METETKKKRLSFPIKLLIALILLAAIAFTYYLTVTRPFVRNLVEEETKAKSVDIINEANTKIKTLVSYGDLFTFIHNSDGEVTYIKSNNALINQINMLASAEIQRQLNESKRERLGIPVGAFTGNALFSAIGNEIPLNVISVGTCATRVRSSFSSVGINQVLHRVYIDLRINVEILAPWRCENVEVWYEIILAENVFSGKVPTTYIASGDQTDYLDLLP